MNYLEPANLKTWIQQAQAGHFPNELAQAIHLLARRLRASEDIAQIVLLRLWANLDRVDANGNVFAYLTNAVRFVKLETKREWFNDKLGVERYARWCKRFNNLLDRETRTKYYASR